LSKRILVITGNGKGKTTSAIGLIIRSLGHKKKVSLFKFFKSQPSGEDKILKNLGVKIFKFKKAFFFKPSKIPKDLKIECQRLWREVEKESENKNLVILDEINLALSANIIKKEVFKKFLNTTKSNIVCTGRNAPLWLQKIADTVSEIKEKKHIYIKGIKAQEGIEF